MKLFILDVSGFIFRAYFALPNMTNPEGHSTHALYGFIRSVNKLIQDFSPDHIVAVFDGPKNKQSRKEIYPEYKANRTQQYDDLPDQIEKAKEFCKLFGLQYAEVDGVEADDTMGTIAKWAEKKGTEVFLCTSDKDLAQLVTEKIRLLNPWKSNLILDPDGVEQNYGVRPNQIIDLLAIMGDTSDNIPGLKGFGPKTAVPLLQEFGTLENLLQNPEKVKGPKKQQTLKEDAEIALLSQKLATIVTDVPFTTPKDDFALHTPNLEALKEFYVTNGFKSLVKSLGFEDEVEQKNYVLVDDKKSLLSLIAKLEKAKIIAVDVETTGLKPLQAKLVGIGFSIKTGTAYYVPINGILGDLALELLKPILTNGHFVGHNIKYDAHILANIGIKLKQIEFDTILASHLLNSASRRHSLDTLALEHFSKVKTSIKSLIGVGQKQISMWDVPIEQVCDYCCEDVDYTLRLYHLLSKELIKRGLLEILEKYELPISAILMKMERAGMYLNVDLLEKMDSDISREITSVEQKIFDAAGEVFNLNSPKQLSEILFEKLGIEPLKKTKSGHSTKAEVLEELARNYPIAEDILHFRTLDKLRSTYIEALPKEVNPKTKRIHPTFSQFITATGRLSCQEPNLQNIPVRTEQGRKIRSAFMPEKEGWSFLSADYSQIELRLLAHLSEDPTLIEAFQKGEDIHAYTARLMFGVDSVSSEQRRQAKAINFGIIYGQQAYGLAKELKINISDAASFIDAYYKRYPKVFDYVETCVKNVKATGKAVTMSGRERPIPEITSSNGMIRAAAERLAINTPLQGSAADLIKAAMIEVNNLLLSKKMKSIMVLQVHDELIFECPNDELPLLKPLVKDAMEKVFELTVPLIVDIHIGKNWGEC